MVILDIETSGIDPRINGMLSLGAVDYETGEEFYGECYLTQGRIANPIALEINGFSEAEIKRPDNQLSGVKDTDITLYLRFKKWAETRSKVLGGHNVGHFDILFLEEIYGREDCLPKHKFPFAYRTVDLHSVAYAKLGESLGHEKICERLGLPVEVKPHNALNGARSECEAFKILLGHKRLHDIDPYLQTR